LPRNLDDFGKSTYLDIIQNFKSDSKLRTMGINIKIGNGNL